MAWTTTAANAGLGFYCLGGPVYNNQRWQPVKLERSGQTWDGPSGTATSFGTRVVAHRYYNASFDTIMNGTILNPGSDLQTIFNGGHVPIVSTGPGNYSSKNTWWADLAAGYTVNGVNSDAQIKKFFQAVHSLDFGGAVKTMTNVPGSDMGGFKPPEFIWCLSHEPNISATKFGSADDFAKAFYHIMTLYDAWCVSNSISNKRLKFCIIVSNPAGSVANIDSVCKPLYGRGTSHDCSTNSGSGRQVDYIGWDIYFPMTQNNSNVQPVSGTSYFGTKMNNLLSWGNTYVGTSVRHVIGELGVRIQTAAGADSTYPLKWWTDSTNGFVAWNNNNRFSNGNHPIAYACSYAAGSLMNIPDNTTAINGGIDDQIIPDMNTYHAKNGKGIYFQNAGFSLRPNANGFYQALVALGNPSMVAGSPGVVPTGVTAVTPAAGATSTTVSWTGNAANVSYNLYRNGSLKQQNITGTSTTVVADKGSLPQGPYVYTISAIGTDTKETAQSSSSASVTFTPLAGNAPNIPTGLNVPISEITNGSALFQATAPAVDASHSAATGYTWIIDGVTTGAPTSISPSYQASGLIGGSHTVAISAFNQYGPSATSSPVSFTVPNAPDATAPSDPGMPSYNAGTLTYKNVDLSWTASTDPVVAGAVTSGVLGYPVYRSNQPDFTTAVLINTPSVNSYNDAAPLAQIGSTTDNYYWIFAEDNARNVTTTPIGPLKVTVPAIPTPPKPTPIISFNIPSGQGQVGQTINLDGSQSIPGQGGAITSYSWNFGDSTSVQNSTIAGVQHIWLSSAQFLVTLTVTDASGISNSVQVPYIVAPNTTNVFPFINLPYLISKTLATANQMNQLVGALDNGLTNHEGRVGDLESLTYAMGSPLTPARHGLVYTSIPPEAVGGSKPMVAGTAYVIRAYVLNGAPFSNFLYHHVNTTSLTGLANTFIAVYDVDGNLMSPPGAQTDQSPAIIATGNGVNVLPFDGGPFTPPLGDDALADNPSNQCYIYFCFGTVGANVPTISTGSSYKFAINFGLNLGPVTPTAANVDQCPIFSTASNGPTAALTPPATLGQLTSYTDSLLIGLG